MVSTTIFQDGKLKPGIYKIQNLYTENYLDIHLHSMELCCRPAKDLGNGRGLWKIRRFGDGYAIWRVDPETQNPYQFCSLMQGLADSNPLCVTSYPVSWGIQRVEDTIHRGFEYVRFRFGPTDRTWDLWGGCKDNGAPVKFCCPTQNAWQMWRLIPMEIEDVDAPMQETFGAGLPPYDSENESRRPSSRAQHVESEHDDFGTVVTEVIVVTTRKKYRVDT